MKCLVVRVLDVHIVEDLSMKFKSPAKLQHFHLHSTISNISALNTYDIIENSLRTIFFRATLRPSRYGASEFKNDLLAVVFSANAEEL